MTGPASEHPELVAAEILVSGRVQGVCYRAFTQEIALSLGLVGWVRNLPDGRVHVELEGPRAQVEQLLSHLRSGPPRAEVREVKVSWKQATGRPRGFSVLP